jgi:adenylylsulfate kinase
MEQRKTIAIDFDGVIHDYKNVPKGKRMGLPLPGAKESIEKMVLDGHKLIIHTVRATGNKEIDSIKDWFKYFGFPMGIPITNIKVNADVYLDDKAIRFTTWEDFSI